MSRKIYGQGLALAALLIGSSVVAGATTAGPLASANPATSIDGARGDVQAIGHRGRRGGPSIGIYIGPGGGYYDDYDYDDYDYYPRRRSYYYDDYAYRSYRKHSRRWVRERFEHPLGRR